MTDGRALHERQRKLVLVLFRSNPRSTEWEVLRCSCGTVAWHETRTEYRCGSRDQHGARRVGDTGIDAGIVKRYEYDSRTLPMTDDLLAFVTLGGIPDAPAAPVPVWESGRQLLLTYDDDL